MIGMPVAERQRQRRDATIAISESPVMVHMF